MLRQHAVRMRARHGRIEDAAKEGPAIDHQSDISCVIRRS
jgi:hypothetical protein